MADSSNTFLGAAPGDHGEVVVLGVPYAHGSPQGSGVAVAPALLRGLTRGERIDEGIWDYGTRRQVINRLVVTDYGDFVYRASMSRTAYLDELRKCSRRLAQLGRIPLALGGDHSITLPLASGIAEAVGPLQVVILDAHHDDSHLAADSQLTHANFVRFLARCQHVSRILQVGIRGYSSLLLDRPPNTIECTVEGLARELSPGIPVYLSVDTDAFDPALAMAVLHPQPKGLTWQDLDRVVETVITAGCRVAGADWTEYDPNLEGRNCPTGIAITCALIGLLAAIESQKAGG